MIRREICAAYRHARDISRLILPSLNQTLIACFLFRITPQALGKAKNSSWVWPMGSCNWIRQIPSNWEACRLPSVLFPVSRCHVCNTSGQHRSYREQLRPMLTRYVYDRNIPSRNSFFSPQAYRVEKLTFLFLAYLNLAGGLKKWRGI